MCVRRWVLCVGGCWGPVLGWGDDKAAVGVLTQAFTADGSVRSSANIGRQIVWDMAAEGAGAYSGGKIWSPDRDKTYSGKMQLDGDGLAVSGCVLGICRDGGTWTRVK